MPSTRTIGQRFRQALRALVGEITWSQPQWFAAASGALKRASANVTDGVRSNPRRAGVIAVAGLAFIAGGLWLWRWYESQPKPVLVAFEVTAPTVTCYACEPPGKPRPLIIQFASSTAPLDRAGHPVEAQQAGVEMTPQLPGQWAWDNDKTLRFEPQSDWPVGAKFRVKFDRKRFAAQAVRLQRQEF